MGAAPGPDQAQRVCLCLSIAGVQGTVSVARWEEYIDYPPALAGSDGGLRMGSAVLANDLPSFENCLGVVAGNPLNASEGPSTG